MQNTSRELKIPDNFDSWIKNEIADTVDQWFRFPSRLTYLFAFIRSNNWDQWFINFFIFWLFLAIFIGDGWAAKYVPFQLNMQNELLMLPIIAMLICQIIPFLGTIYYMNYCYDLVHYSAQINFSQWVRLRNDSLFLLFIAIVFFTFFILGFCFRSHCSVYRIFLLRWTRSPRRGRSLCIRRRGPPPEHSHTSMDQRKDQVNRVQSAQEGCKNSRHRKRRS